MAGYAATALTLPLVERRPPLSRTKILVLGMRRTGKTSILKVLLEDMPLKDTFYLETTMRIKKYYLDSIIPLEIWDCPANIVVESLGPLTQFSTMIYIIDILGPFLPSISNLVEYIDEFHRYNPRINIEVFIHKAEKFQEDDKLESLVQIQERVTDHLLDRSPDYEQNPVSFHLTSIHDHSLRYAFSSVLQKLIDSLPYLEDLLNVFCANSKSPKAFLFDICTRSYVATDAAPVDSSQHNICFDHLHMLNSFGPLYKSASASPMRGPHAPGIAPPSSISLPSLVTANASPPAEVSLEHPMRQKELFYPSAAAVLHPATPGTTLTYHSITSTLALVAIIPTVVYVDRRGLLEYNVVYLREGVREICDVETEVRGG